MTAIPTTLDDYLARLRRELSDADPALVQDALYDAEEHIRTVLAEQPGRSEAEVLTEVAGSYGDPAEVADIYRDTEIKIARALKPPQATPSTGILGRLFGVFTDPHAYGAIFYMLLALATGTFYFTWVVTGLSLSAGFSILIIGLPFVILFVGSVRLLMLLEGRIVETLLGQRMPRRPPHMSRDGSLISRIAGMFTDSRTWLAMIYMLLMLPLGTAYFTVAVTLCSVCLSFAFAPIIDLFVPGSQHLSIGAWDFEFQLWMLPITLAIGAVLMTGFMHLARLVGRMHGGLAKHLLVRPG